MLGRLFESREQRTRDQWELKRLLARYGDEAKKIVLARASNPTLSERDRNHWRRIAKKI
jgi:hypothetical protein